MRVPSAARPIAMRWLVKASVGSPGPWSENVRGEVAAGEDLAGGGPHDERPCLRPADVEGVLGEDHVEDVGEDEVDRGGRVGPWALCQLRNGDRYVLDHALLVRWWRCIGGCEARHACGDSSCESCDRGAR